MKKKPGDLQSAILNNTHVLMACMDRNFNFIVVNENYAHADGREPDFYVGKNHFTLFPNADNQAIFQRVVDTGDPYYIWAKPFEYAEHPERGVSYWDWSLKPVKDEDGQVSMLVMTLWDVTPRIKAEEALRQSEKKYRMLYQRMRNAFLERKRLENELKRNNESLEDRVLERTEDLQRLNEALMMSNKELESFAYITSHDLQEPLRMITSYTQLLEMKYNDKLDENANEYIRYAVEGAKRMYDLINGFLDYSKLSKGGHAYTDVDMNKVTETVMANLSLLVKERNCIIEAGKLPVVKADNSQMIRLLQNLITNGIKFSRNEPLIKIKSIDEVTQFVFSVEDNGIGIEEQYFERIFEIFKRLNSRENFEGTGIGLAICKRIVENHKGKIWVESTPGQGSVFYFTIPKQSS